MNDIGSRSLGRMILEMFKRIERTEGARRPALRFAACRFAVCALLGTMIGTAPGSAQEYRLGVQDKVRIVVQEWRASQGEVYDWKPLAGEYTVGTSGAVSLPLLGPIPAAGLKVDELAATISERLKQKVGLSVMPDTAVEIVQLRPFYIMGKVEKPGEYAYRPGLTVLQAVSVAGGLYRPIDANLLRLEREQISAEGSVANLIQEADQLIARRARLEAELQGQDTIAFPRDLSRPASDSSAAALMQQEQTILKARAEALRSQTDALRDLKKLLAKEITSLEARVDLKDRQLGLVRKELENVGSLVSKGLAVVPRQFSLERAEAEVETNRLELDTALLRARQEISRADRNIIELQSQRRNDILAELRLVTGSLEITNQKIQTGRKLAAEANAYAGQFAVGGLRDQNNRPVFSIIRGSGNEAVETIVSEAAPVLPGDIVRVIGSLDVRTIGPGAAAEGQNPPQAQAKADVDAPPPIPPRDTKS